MCVSGSGRLVFRRRVVPQQLPVRSFWCGVRGTEAQGTGQAPVAAGAATVDALIVQRLRGEFGARARGFPGELDSELSFGLDVDSVCGCEDHAGSEELEGEQGGGEDRNRDPSRHTSEHAPLQAVPKHFARTNRQSMGGQEAP
ncbi:hypothetical protein GCM10010478_47720 [Streptomyces erythrogriseus]|uniref:Uncharacterized protein n=1 Tax=Streptomyces erythrogriseus TaxID=284027 RepID=A0ABN3X7U6_9ACTN